MSDTPETQAMTPEQIKQADNLLEADWRQQLPPALQSVAERHGKNRFIVAYNIGSVQEACGNLMEMGSKSKAAMHMIQIIARSANELAHHALRQVDMDSKLLMEVQTDIQRAVALTNAAPNGGDGKIIVAN